MPRKAPLSPINLLKSIEALLDVTENNIPPTMIHRTATLVKGTKHIYDGSPIEMLPVKLCEEIGADMKTVRRWIWRWLLDQRPTPRVGVKIDQKYSRKIWTRLEVISQAGDI